jgi:5'-phosphate synthase pdxT subunit
MGTMKPRVGVLALQGDFAAHEGALERAGAETVLVRDREQLDGLAGLVIPGGESTTMLKLLGYDGFFNALHEFGERKPIFGTCAGAILLADRVENPPQASLGLMNITVERNAYGRQLDSRVTAVDPEPELSARTSPGKLEAVFIRAPIVRETRGDARVLARYKGDPVLVEQGRHLAATFHPELTGDARIHELFLKKL